MTKTAYSNTNKALFLLTIILLVYSLVLFILSRFGILPINRYLGLWVIAPLTGVLFCLSMIVIIRLRFSDRKVKRNGLTIPLALLALLASAVGALFIWSNTVLGSDFSVHVSPDGNRKIVVESIRNTFNYHYTAYPVVFPGFYRLQDSGYIYLGENTGTADIEWQEDKAVVTVRILGDSDKRIEQERTIVVDFKNPKPWKPLVLHLI